MQRLLEEQLQLPHQIRSDLLPDLPGSPGEEGPSTNRPELDAEVRRLIHDLNNVLTGILGYAELSMTCCTEGTNRTQYLSQVLEQAQRGVGLLAAFRHGRQLRSARPTPGMAAEPVQPGLDGAQAGQGNPAQPANDGRQWTGKRILVVDDDPLLLQLMCHTLTSAGYQVLAALDAVQALRVQENTEEPFDLLLTDVYMPQMSGLELLQEMQCLGRMVPAVLTSGSLALEELKENALVRYCRLLPKPFQAKELLQVVRGSLDAAPNGIGEIEAETPLSS